MIVSPELTNKWEKNNEKLSAMDGPKMLGIIERDFLIIECPASE